MPGRPGGGIDGETATVRRRTTVNTHAPDTAMLEPATAPAGTERWLDLVDALTPLIRGHRDGTGPGGAAHDPVAEALRAAEVHRYLAETD